MSRRSKDIAASYAADDFVDQFRDLIISLRLEKAARDDLHFIARDAADLSWSLWAQKSEIRIWNLNDISEREGKPSGTLPLRYFANTQLVEPSKLHSAQLDDDATALNGAQVLFLCNPVLVMFGDSEGNSLTAGKVLKRGVVWMGRMG